MNKLAKTALSLMIATLIGKVLGFVRELVLASSYGTSSYSDAYLIAMNIPLVIVASIGSAIATTFIPMYSDINNKYGEKKANEYVNNIFNIILIISIILSLIGFIFTEKIVAIFATGFQGEIFNVAVDFTRILIVSIIFYGLSYIMTAYLQVKGNFIIPGLVTIPRNIVIIISIFLSIKISPYFMVWGTLLAFSIDFIFQLPFAIKNGYKYRYKLNLKEESITKTIWLIGPVLLGVAVNQINTMVDRTLASTLAEGSISALNYANKLNGFVGALFIASIATVIYPMLSKLSSEDNKEKFTKEIVQSVNSVILLVIPISVGAIVLATPVVKLLFQRGAFDSRATSMTSIALIMYSIGMVAFGLRDILGKVFYALQDTKTPMVNGAIAMVMNIVLNIILVKYLQLAGLALATSISAIVCILLLFASLKKKIGDFGQEKIIKTTLKSIVSASIMGIITYTGYNFIISMLGTGFVNEAISLFGSILIGAIVYGILIIVLKVEEARVIIDIIKKKLSE